ncbi:MAG: hypothetical protein IJR49_06005 [Treponema sp.]|nr:hypothetical protein [Treponema sp.]
MSNMISKEKIYNVLISCVFTLSVLSMLFLFSCKNRTQNNVQSNSLLEVDKTIDNDLFPNTQTWHAGNECICILFGYGYNDDDFVSSITQSLYKKYGAEEDGGLIKAIVFPDDFKRGTRSIAAELPLLVGEKQLRGIITLGAPENTHFALAHIQDSRVPVENFPIISFFPQDNVSGMEGTSDIILDKAQDTNEDASLENEHTQVFVSDVPDFIFRSIAYSLALDAPLPKNADLQTHLKAIIGNRNFTRYVDPETGLPSINHFILK